MMRRQTIKCAIHTPSQRLRLPLPWEARYHAAQDGPGSRQKSTTQRLLRADVSICRRIRHSKDVHAVG